MGKYYLCISWKDNPPLDGINVWRVNGDIEYKDGKLVFQTVRGVNVDIDPDQLVSIGITEAKNE